MKGEFSMPELTLLYAIALVIGGQSPGPKSILDDAENLARATKERMEEIAETTDKEIPL